MKEAYRYRGHSIELSLTEVHEHFGYTYFIDTQYCFQGPANSLDAEAARADALNCAHRSIALLDAMNPPTLPHVATSLQDR